jgi:general secretion pathway protein E
VFELLVTDDAIRAQIHAQASKPKSAPRGMALMRLVQTGITSREELVRVTRD